MEDFTLDFSTLTGDQMVGLLRSVLRECVQRGAAVQAAAQAAWIDESEAAQIATEAATREAAKLRAQARERIAREAAEGVRAEVAAKETQAQAARNTERLKREAEQAEATRRGAEQAGRIAAEKARIQEEREKAWLRRAGALVSRDPAAICLLCLRTDYGVRVLINPSTDRYDREHLVDWHVKTNKITTIRELIGRKLELTAFCAEFNADSPNAVYLLGSSYTWEEK